MSTSTGPVLIVEDDHAVRRSLKFALEVEGMQVRLYGSGAELLADQDVPRRGCLVVDYYLPEMNGIDVLDRLRARKTELPAILITTNASPKVRSRAARSGFRQVLEKPLQDSSLVAGIQNALSGST